MGEVVAEDYARAAVFSRLGIDFCCGGTRTVRAACQEAGVSTESLQRELANAPQGEGSWQDPRDWSPSFLADYIVEVHHGYVRKALPTLLQFSQKVARRHGAANPELPLIRDLVAELAREMTRHMADEESELFPWIAGLAKGEAAAVPSADELDPVLANLMDDHDHAGGVMRRIRELSQGFTPPSGACATYRATYRLLEEFEADLHRHVHLENNVLFPKVATLREESGTAA